MIRMAAEKLAAELNAKTGNLSVCYAVVADINASTYSVGKFIGGKLSKPLIVG